MGEVDIVMGSSSWRYCACGSGNGARRWWSSSRPIMAARLAGWVRVALGLANASANNIAFSATAATFWRPHAAWNST